jgi:thiosulfate reductase cytochrome b subunit
MAGFASLPRLAIRNAAIPDSPRHSALVRITHWINTLSFFGLLISGVAILLAHPRLYWGETGNLGTPSLIDLPLPFVLTGQTGWGRSLHFLAGWVCVLNGSLYVVSGLITRHWPPTYNLLQRMTYLVVIAVAFPLTIWTGLAMSPAIASVFPVLVASLGGQQSARTVHFFAAGFLVVFLLAHIAMVCLAGFKEHVRAMIPGYAPRKDRA